MAAKKRRRFNAKKWLDDMARYAVDTYGGTRESHLERIIDDLNEGQHNDVLNLPQMGKVIEEAHRQLGKAPRR